MSDVVVYAYAACSTCKNALKWLEKKGVSARVVPIVESPPTEAELKKWMAASGLPSRKWFNTSGQSYRAMTTELGKEAVAAMTDSEIRTRLAADGKLIKRPVLVREHKGKTTVLVGFDEAKYAETFGG